MTTFTKKMSLAAAVATAVTLTASAALAHPGHPVSGAGFVDGLAHPFSGLDHLLAMIGLGLWATTYQGRSKWALPAAFVTGMIVGGILGITGFPLPMVELGIAGSVVVIGALVALGTRLPVPAAMAVAFGFAIFHGHAHGAEMAEDAVAALYGAGFVLATAVLHAIGIALGLAAAHPRARILVRAAGAAMACAGLALAAG